MATWLTPITVDNDPLPSTAEVVVVGGGVQGCSIGYHLARAGVNVVLVERYDVAAGASGASAGGVRHQGRDLREFPLAFAAIERWRGLEEELGFDLGYRRGGHLTLIEDEADLTGLELDIDRQVVAGLDISLVAGDALRDLVPGIGPTVVAGAFSPDDGHADPERTTAAFAFAAQRVGAPICAGTTVARLIVEGDHVLGVETDGGSISTGTVVLAGGAWSTALAAAIGLDLPIEPMGLQAMTTVPAPHVLGPVMGSTTRVISLKQLPDGRFLLGGGWPGTFDLDRPRGRTLAENIAANVVEAVAILPAVAAAPVQRAWLGIEALTRDEAPILGPVDGIDGLILATGFCGHGFALSPAVGAAISTLITTGQLPDEIAALTLARFADTAEVEPLATTRAG